MLCNWRKQKGGGVACEFCGTVRDKPRARNCQADQVGLGDWLERQFASIGITPDRYAHAKELFGLSPACNCKARKEWLNKLSDWWRNSLADE